MTSFKGKFNYLTPMYKCFKSMRWYLQIDNNLQRIKYGMFYTLI